MSDWNKSRFKTAEIEFGDDSAPDERKSSPIKKLYDFFGSEPEPSNQTNQNNPGVYANQINQAQTPEKKSRSYSYDLDGGVLITCKIEEWGRGFTLFGDFIRDAKKYYKKTCVNANYIYFFSYRPMYRELNHEQLCWYLFWRSRIREGIYLKTGLSYIFLYLYEQINLSDIIGPEKVYANIIKIWNNYRIEFPRIDKYIAEWLADFSFVHKLKINLNDDGISDILTDIINIVTIPEVYIREDFFRAEANTGFIIKNMAMHDYKKSKFYNEKNQEFFDLHIYGILHSVLSSPGFDDIIKKETENGVTVKTTRESFMGAVCIFEHKKRITVEYKNLYKNFYIRQCVTDTVRYAENAVRDYLGIKSRLNVSGFPEELKKIIDEYKNKYLIAVKPQKISVNKKKGKREEPEEIPEVIEFNPNIETASEIEKSSWDTTFTLVELQENSEIKIDDGEFIEIDTGDSEEDIFDVLESIELAEAAEPAGLTDMERFIASLTEEERYALEALIDAKAQNKSFDVLCGEFLSGSNGKMLESVIDYINIKAMDFTGDIIFDTANREIPEDYREEIEEGLKK
ncbi:MAG: TerB N-terminal domain-containing protein [Oscillospiraceae bacterium]|nr:TerB N-terminal domain-containing protein [Oscillospiraceae bacterium]